jgi:large subunit ribosomal protein L4
MKTVVLNHEGKEEQEISLPKEIFGVEINPDLLHQVVVSQLANRRQTIAHTKDRSEVRGGGRKPWRQKGTGRARHGSIRSPLWKGGGVVFGPRKEKVFKKIIPKKMRRKALFMALSTKLKNNCLILLKDLNFKIEEKKGKASLTKSLVNFLKNFPCQKGSILLVLPQYDRNIILAARNLPKVKTIQAKDLNPLDILSFKYLLMPKEALKVIKETFLKKK